MKRVLLFTLPLLLLTACVTTGGRSVDLKAAAQDNVKLGTHYLRSGNLQTAKDKLERAEKQDPKNPDVYWTQALLYEQLEKPGEAEQKYQKAMNLAPASPELLNTYASFLCKQGQVDRALPIYEKVMTDRLYPQPYVAATNAGVCLHDQKRDADAQRYFERALALGPEYPDAVVGLADLKIAQGKPDEARKAVEKFMAAGNKDADVLVVGVRAAAAQRECGFAQTYARLLRRDFPGTPQASALPQSLGNCATTN